MSYSLQCQGSPRRTAAGEILATVVLVDESGAELFSDRVNLTLIRSRGQFAKELLKRFPDLKGQDLEGQLLELMRKIPPDQGQDSAERVPQAQILVALARKTGHEFFHDGQNTFVALEKDGHREVWPIRSQNYKFWLSKAYFEAEDGKVPNLDALGAALNTLGGLAMYDGPDYSLANRVAWRGEELWVDMSDTAWRALKVTLDGWEIVDRPPILFRRHTHQLPQVTPVQGGNPKAILKFLRPSSEMEAMLWLTYIGTCFIPDIPHPIPILYGDAGAGKSKRLEWISQLVDPSMAPLLSASAPKDEAALIQILYHHWITFCDNVSSLPDWFSDTLCRASTGQAFEKRTLFTDDDPFLYKGFKRCVGLNGINNMAEKPDLLDRSLLMRYQRIPGTELMEEKKLDAAFETEKPAILGGFLDILVKALAIRPEVSLPWRSRMVDFMVWGAAIARALGYKESQFLQTYADNIRAQNQTALAVSLVAPALQEFMEARDSWRGTYGTLLGELGPIAESQKTDTRQRAWPKNATWLSRRINQVRVNLQAVGISVEDSGSGRDITLLKDSGNSVFSGNGTEVERGSGTDAKPHPIADFSGFIVLPGPEIPQSHPAINANQRQDVENSVVPTSEAADSDQNAKHAISAALGGEGHAETSDDLPEYPTAPCFACGGGDYWLVRNQWLCCRCHPNPNPEAKEISDEARFLHAFRVLIEGEDEGPEQAGESTKHVLYILTGREDEWLALAGRPAFTL